MGKDIYLTKYVPDQGITPGRLVVSDKTVITAMDGKTISSISEKNADGFLKRCKLTCGRGYTLMMVLNTSYHTYRAIGRELPVMYKKIVFMYNSYAGTEYTADNFATSEDMADEHLHVYRMKSDLLWFDDECFALPDSEFFVGDYFSLYRPSNWVYKDDWFNQSML